jgi:hypothetical protein
MNTGIPKKHFRSSHRGHSGRGKGAAFNLMPEMVSDPPILGPAAPDLQKAHKTQGAEHKNEPKQQKIVNSPTTITGQHSRALGHVRVFGSPITIKG